MSLVIDNTVGGASSNSYVALSDLPDYFSGRSDASSFLAATDTQKTARLVQATQINDLLLFAYGDRATTGQALEFPRTDLVDKHGREYTSTEIPAKIKYAQMEQALYLFSNSIKIPSIVTQGFSHASVDVLKITADRSMIPSKLDTDAMDYLSEFGDVSYGSIGGVHSSKVNRY